MEVHKGNTEIPTHIPKKKGSDELTGGWELEDDDAGDDPTLASVPEEEYEDMPNWNPDEDEEEEIDFRDIDFSEPIDPTVLGKEDDVSYLPLTNKPQRVKSRNPSKIDPTHAMYDVLKRLGHKVEPDMSTSGAQIVNPVKSPIQ